MRSLFPRAKAQRWREAGASAMACAGMGVAVCCSVAHAGQDVGDMDITELVNVRLSPFDVASNLDRGYRASNAVSGSRFDAPIRELPFAIQAFSEAFIVDQKPVNLFDVARYSPGVTYRSNDFNEGNANLAIRGFAVSQLAGAPQVLRDGHNGPSIFDFTNVSRVEVVKGPSSFLYGQVAPGGIVNVITKSPQARFSGMGELGYGSYGQYRAQADVTGPLTSTLLFRVAASYDEDMHYWKPYDAHSSTVAPSLQWRPDDRFSLSLKYENFHKLESPQVMQKPGYGRQSGAVPTPGDPNRAGEDVPGLPDDWNSMADVDYRSSDAQGATAWADLQLDEHWNLRTRYSQQQYVIDMLFSGNLGMANNTTFLQGRRLRQQYYENRDRTWSVDAVGKYQFAGASLRLLLGAQQVTRRFDRRAGQAPNDPALGSDPVASPLPLWDLRDPSTWNRQVDIPLSALTASRFDVSTRNADRSFYAGSTFGFFDDRLLVLAGLRSTSTRTEFIDRLAGSTQPFSSRKTTPQYGILYKLAPGISAFASYAESFVPGQQILRRPDDTLAPAQPTQGHGYDFGLKADLLDGKVSGTLTLFNLRNSKIVNDLSTTNVDGSVSIRSVQSGEQRSRGLELDATLQPTPDWQVYLSYSYMDARIVEFSGRDAEILAQDPATLDAAGLANYKNAYLLHGARLQMSAPHIANLWFRHDLGDGLYLGGGFNFVRDQTLLPDSPPSLRQTYTLWNALAGYSWTSGGRRFSAELMGKNLGDEHYRPSQSTRSRPREVLATLKVSL
ncbi:TonB-dependent siderophore receptor [Ideonella sp. YS5]|uniref:TonB-dependent siderophore receptor n=1 Tax=Ideonella sp. YS5 TaxID=3453714 RepID=UPI003EEF7684